MSRKTIDCATAPNEVGCTLSLSGEQEELLEAAAAHAVAVHGHTDSPDLRAALLAALTDAPVHPSAPGAFVQAIEFDADSVEDWDTITDRFVAALGDRRRTRWSVVCIDRERPGRHIALIEFPDHAAAAANSAQPETTQWFKEFQAMCTGEPSFRNLDVVNARQS